MESSTIELKVMSCRDLKGFNFFQKLLVYTSVSIVSEDPEKKVEQNQQQRTPTDGEGDGNPEWNHEMRFDLKEVSLKDCDHLFIQFELLHEGVMFGNKNIGEVRVPLKGLLQEFNGVVRFVNYEVRTTDGKPNGVLSFSYKVIGNDTAIGTNSPEITGFAIVHHLHHQQHHHHHQQQQTSEIPYPSLDVHSSTPEVSYPVSSPPQSLYPTLELQSITQETYSTTQDVQYLSPTVSQHVSHQENYYPPPDAYYPPPPPPPFFPHPSLPHLPPPMEHSPYYPPPHGPHSPHSPPFNHWAPEPHIGAYNHGMPGTWSPAAEHLHGYQNGEMSPNGFQDWRNHHHHSSSWNDR